MTELPGKDGAIDLLESIGLLLELKGENSFKVRAYTQAARALELFSGDLALLAREGRLKEIEGVGAATAEKLSTYLTTGRLEYHEKLLKEFPPEIFELFEIQGLGAKRIKLFYDMLQIHSVEGLEKACADGRVAALPGLGEKSAQKLQAAIGDWRKNCDQMTFGKAAPLAEKLLSDFREHPDVLHLSAAGSYRRRKEVLHDIDLLVASRMPEEITAAFVGHPLVESIIASGPTKSSVRLKGGLQCDLRVVKPEEYPFALLYFTGSKEHNVALRSRALKRGWTLNEYRLAPVEGRQSEAIPEIRTEEEVYRALGLDPIVPELREDCGELDAAEHGRLPNLVEIENLRGTFHNHTNASDGRATLEEMAEAAQELGLEYLGIADHSKSSFQARGLDEARLAAQVESIGRLNAANDGFQLFSGTECDILRDGTLDFSDETLSTLDYVVASIHSSFTLPEAEMTVRIIRAISNPHVTMLGHLTGRLLLSREPYRVDIPAVIEAAAATGTIIEINANPKRLDMDWRWWPLAKEKGVKCAINPDAHRVEGLKDLWFGVGVARKGWLTRADVINCQPLEKVRETLQAKRLPK